ncbi:hypothetical protein ACXX82_17610 [Glaciimonas sp. GNP009]
MSNHMIIDFSNIGGPVYSGRPRGELIRAKFALDNIDQSSTLVDIQIPETTYSITSSFFLGLFGPSVVKAGSVEAFFSKYHFEAKPVLTKAFRDYAGLALQAKALFSNKN